ncbi:fibronectin type III domain-containing protein [Streptosporangium longisporum]|uniref:Fibronectin type-III domain-containing protein n=1 Tax=Streptosporangium longisporum TaxID=46187 RepID=A0ABP6LDV4_9ACTN
MAVTEVLMGLGGWAVQLSEETPREVLDRLQFFGHVALVPGRVNVAEYQDELLTMARYVGVLTGRESEHRKVIKGQGMAVWLGDSDDKGEVLESPIQITGATFPNAIRALLGSSTAVVEGTLYSAAGTYTGRHQWQSRRKAVDYVCSTMSCDWRVNGNATLDAGPSANLFKVTPTCVIVREGAVGPDMTLTGLPGDMALARDVEDWTSRVVLLAEGEGASVATAGVNILSNPYQDLRGQPVQRTRLVSESGTATTNAQARAQLQLNRFSGTRNAMQLSAKDYDIRGAFVPGDWVWVYDPDSGLYDVDNEVIYRGQRINPIRLRAVEASWPVAEGMTVGYRHQDGTWLDLTPYVLWESGATSVVVGELNRALTNSGGEPVGPRPTPDATVPGQVSWVLPFETSVYLDALGGTRANIMVSWDTPLNEDGSTILDGDHYEIRYDVSPATSWRMAYAAWGDTQVVVGDLSPGVLYDFGIRAVDLSGNAGEWSVTESATAHPDTIPPSTPAAPVVAGSSLALQVRHELGKATGGVFNLELDLSHLEIHVGDSSGFTPDETTLKGQVAATAGMMQAEIAAVGTVEVEETTTRWVRVVAVDQAGNRSAASAAASATALLVDSAHISDLTVTKVTAGTISSNWLIGASIRTASSGQRVELNATGLHGYNGGGTELVSLLNDGSFTLRTAASGARVEVNAGGIGVWNSGGVQTVALEAGTGVFFMRSGTSGARVDLSTVSGLSLYDNDGVNTVALSPSGSFTLRSDTSGARVELSTSGLRTIDSSGVTTVDLNASGAFTLRSDSSGARVELDVNGLRGYSSAGQTFKLDAATGDVDIVGRLTSTVSSSAKRLVINPIGADPEIRMYEDATRYHYLTSYAAEGTLQIGSVTSSNRKYTVSLSPGGDNYIGIVDGVGTTAIAGIRFTSDGYTNVVGAGLTGSSGGPLNFRVQSAPGDGMFRCFWNGSDIQFVRNDINFVVKTFIIDHPQHPDRYLVHGVTESPHNGVEYWGTATLDEDGQAVVELPSYFEALTRADGRAVLLSCLDVPGEAAATYPDGGRFHITGPPARRVGWLVKAIRADVPPLLVEPRRTEVDVHGDGPYRYYTMRT